MRISVASTPRPSFAPRPGSVWRDDPFDLLRHLNPPAAPWDVYETEDRVVVETPLPGFSREAIDLSIDHQVLVLKATPPEVPADRTYRTRSVPRGEVHRVLTLPEGVEVEGAEASLRDGMLRIEFPRREEAKPRTIPIAE